MRSRAIEDRKGLFTLEAISASKKPGKLGSRMTMQSPADEEEYKAVTQLILKLIKRRSARGNSRKRRGIRSGAR